MANFLCIGASYIPNLSCGRAEYIICSKCFEEILTNTSDSNISVDQPKNPQYANFELYGAQGTRNFYVTVDDYDDLSNKVSLGIWHLVPEKLVDEAEGSEGFDYQDSLRNSGWPVILYFHGNSGTRIAPLKTYKVLRKFFHVLAFDYRST